MGRPEDVALVERSHTGAWLRTVLPTRPTRGRAVVPASAVTSDR
jgi:hypothetical protein